ncbi:MAG TPA: hypothetical protein VFI84_04475 [Candidatus Saccharimonadales bacterium]|nr:hypothetical protein [Candidatus Saccharimonadales bacterium]
MCIESYTTEEIARFAAEAQTPEGLLMVQDHLYRQAANYALSEVKFERTQGIVQEKPAQTRIIRAAGSSARKRVRGQILQS